jgi:hypothetical protein
MWVSLIGIHCYFILLTDEHVYLFRCLVDYVHVLLVVVHKEGPATRQTTHRGWGIVCLFHMLCASSWSFNKKKHNRFHGVNFIKNKQKKQMTKGFFERNVFKAHVLGDL